MYILIWTWLTLKLFHQLSFHIDWEEEGKLSERGVGNILPYLGGTKWGRKTREVFGPQRKRRMENGGRNMKNI